MIFFIIIFFIGYLSANEPDVISFHFIPKAQEACDSEGREYEPKLAFPSKLTKDLKSV